MDEDYIERFKKARTPAERSLVLDVREKVYRNGVLMEKELSKLLGEERPTWRPTPKSTGPRKRGQRPPIEPPPPYIITRSIPLPTSKVRPSLPPPKVEKITAPYQQRVYVIGAAGEPVKVGIATDVKKRLSGIQTGQHKPLSILFERELYI